MRHLRAVAAGLLLILSTPAAAAQAQRRASLDTACTAGDARACTELGLILASGHDGTLNTRDPNPRAAVPYFQRACARGVAEGCDRLGELFERGEGVASNLTEAAGLYGLACDGGYFAGCASLARLHDASTGVPRDAVRAKALFDRAVALEVAACDRGDGDECQRLASIVWKGSFGLTPDPARALRLDERACELGAASGCTQARRRSGAAALRRRRSRRVRLAALERVPGYRTCLLGDAQGCFQTGNRYLGHFETQPTDYPRAAYFFLKGCDAGEPHLCAMVGEMYEEGKGVAADAARAAELYRRACDASSGEGCWRLGMLYARGAGVPRDPVRAAEAYQRGCDTHPGPCLDLAEMLQQGNGVNRDVARAASLYEKLCAEREPLACVQIGLAYRDGTGVARDTAAAMKRFSDTCSESRSIGCREACELGDGQACVKAAMAYDTGDGVRPDVAVANDLYDRAIKALDAGCTRGDQRACASGVELFRLVRSVPIADGAMAARFYARACDARMGAGCHLAAGLYDRGQGVALDRRRAADLYERGCDGGEIDSCLRVADMYRLGQGVPASPGHAAMFAERAAELRRQRRR